MSDNEFYTYDWNNLDLDSEYIKDKYLIDPLTIRRLLDDLYHTRDLTPSNIEKIIEEELETRKQVALEIIRNNIYNIISYVQNERGFE